MSELLRIENLEVKFKERTLFQNFNLALPSGDFFCLLGPSGCGKSTLLRVMAGLLPPTSGSLHWTHAAGQTDSAQGFVFQDPHLLPWRNILENTLLPLEIKGVLSAREQQERATTALQQVGLGAVLHAYPHELSGGMKMRVSIARALVTRPRVLFMDEPFAALDEVTRFKLQIEIRQLCEQEKLSVFFVTHSTFEAAFLADRILVLSATGGQIVLDQGVDYLRPRTAALRVLPEYHRFTELMSQSLQPAAQELVTGSLP